MNHTLNLVATLFVAAGTIFILAMSFGVMTHGLALFLGTSCFVIGGLLWGNSAAVRRADPARRPEFEPTVSSRDDR